MISQWILLNHISLGTILEYNRWSEKHTARVFTIYNRELEILETILQLGLDNKPRILDKYRVAETVLAFPITT